MNASKPHSLGSFCNSFLSEGKRRVIVTHFCQKMHSLSLLYQSMRPWCLSIPEHMWFAVPTYKMCVFVFLFSASGSPYMCVRSAMWNFLYAAFFSLIMCTCRSECALVSKNGICIYFVKSRIAVRWNLENLLQILSLLYLIYFLSDCKL